MVCPQLGGDTSGKGLGEKALGLALHLQESQVSLLPPSLPPRGADVACPCGLPPLRALGELKRPLGPLSRLLLSCIFL